MKNKQQHDLTAEPQSAPDHHPGGFMETLFTNQELLFMLAGVVSAAIFAGFMAGFLGIGGGIILVTVFYWIFTLSAFPDALSMHMAVATSIATIVFTAISSMRAHHAKGGVDVSLLKLWAPAMAIGALSGGLASRFIDPWGLKVLFGFMAILIAFNFLKPKPLILANRLPTSKAINIAIAYVIGGIASLMGIGGGALATPTMSAFSVPMKRAVGTSSAFGFIIAVPAVIGFMIAGQGIEGRPPFSIGYVNVVAVLVIIPFTMFFAPIGARLAQTVDVRWVKYSFATFLLISSLRMLYSVFI